MRGEFVAGRRGDGASVCHLCGYAHPISELLAHSKICCKKISTATTEEGAGELGDTVLLLGTVDSVLLRLFAVSSFSWLMRALLFVPGGDKEEQGERTGSNAAECGCGLTASAVGDAAQDGGDAAQDGGNAGSFLLLCFFFFACFLI